MLIGERSWLHFFVKKCKICADICFIHHFWSQRFDLYSVIPRLVLSITSRWLRTVCVGVYALFIHPGGSLGFSPVDPIGSSPQLWRPATNRVWPRLLIYCHIPMVTFPMAWQSALGNPSNPVSITLKQLRNWPVPRFSKQGRLQWKLTFELRSTLKADILWCAPWNIKGTINFSHDYHDTSFLFAIRSSQGIQLYMSVFSRSASFFVER